MVTSSLQCKRNLICIGTTSKAKKKQEEQSRSYENAEEDEVRANESQTSDKLICVNDIDFSNGNKTEITKLNLFFKLN
jgi:hypothetical protein